MSMSRLSHLPRLGLASLLLCAAASGAEEESVRVHPLSRSAVVGHYAPFLINRVFGYYRNNGIGAYNPVSGSAGFEFPKETDSTARYTNRMVLYCDGILWGGYHRDALRVGGSSYSSALQPGRILSPGTAERPPIVASADLPSARVYRVRRDIWPQMPAEAALAIIRDEERWLIGRYAHVTDHEIYGQYVSDWKEWPASEGAPFEDLNANGRYDWESDVPGEPGADQTLWYVANDCDSTLVANGTGSRTIGLEMQRTIWGYRNAGWLENALFLRTRLVNKSGSRLDSLFLAQWADPDLGEASDDYVGCDTTEQFGYAYNAREYDIVYRAPTPAFGAVLLQGPVVPSPGDTAIVLGRRRSGFRNLSIHAFPLLMKSHSLYGDPLPTSPEQWYRDMNGVAARTGEPYVDPVTGEVTRICFAGDPITGQGWTDGGPFPPGDRRILVSSGPFAMAAGDTQEIVVAHVAAQGEDRLASLAILRSYAGAARALYQTLMREVPPGIAAEVRYTGPAEATISVQADCRHGAYTAATTLLVSATGSTVAEIPLTDDGTRGDVTAADRIFFGSAAISRQPNPLRVKIRIRRGSGEDLLMDPVVDPVTTAGVVSLASPILFSDNINSDGNVNPGEAVRYGVTVSNGTPFPLSGVRLRQLTDEAEGLTVQLDVVPAGGTRALRYDPSNASSFLSFFTTADNPPPVRSLPISIQDAAGNVWRDTVSFMVRRLPYRAHRDTLVHTKGAGTGNFEILVVDPAQFTGDTYTVRGVDSINSAGDPGILLVDVTAGKTLLLNHPLPDSLGHSMPVTDGFKVLRGSTAARSGRMIWYETQGLPGWTSSGAFNVLNLEGYGGTIGNGTDHWPSGGAGYRRQHSVLIRFAPTDTLGNLLRGTRYDTLASFAYRYLLNADQPPAKSEFVPFIKNTSGSFAYQEYGLSLPFAAYDLGSSPPRRLMVGHLENNVPGGRVDGRYWPPVYNEAHNGTWTGPCEWFFIFDVPYAAAPDPSLAVDILNVHVPLAWVGYPARLKGRGFSPPLSQGGYRIDEFTIQAERAPGSGDEWTITLRREEFLPETFSLSQNYPNPFNPATTIRYALAYPGSVTLAVYNILGQKVRTLVSGNQYAGEFSVAWDGRNEAGLPVSSGVYVCRLEARRSAGEPVLLSRKMMVLR